MTKLKKRKQDALIEILFFDLHYYRQHTVAFRIILPACRYLFFW